MKLVLVGNRVDEGIIEVTKFGEEFELPDALAADVLKKGTVMTAESFKKLGFTPDELVSWAEPWRHVDAPQTFLSKKARALAAAQSGDKPSTQTVAPATKE